MHNAGRRIAWKIRVAWNRMRLVVFETIQILIALPADITFVWLLFLHALGTWVGRRCVGIDDRKGSVRVVVQLLSVVAMLRMSLVGCNVHCLLLNLQLCGTSTHFGSYKLSRSR